MQEPARRMGTARRWPAESDLTLQDTVRRELWEECNIAVVVGDIIHADLLAIGQKRVVILAMDAKPIEPIRNISISNEHTAARLFPTDDLPLRLPDTYRLAIQKAVKR